MNQPSFNLTLPKTIRFHLELNDKVEVFSKKNVSYDGKGSSGYIFHLENIENQEEETKFIIKVIKSNIKVHSEGAIGFLVNTLNFNFFPKFIRVRNYNL